MIIYKKLFKTCPLEKIKEYVNYIKSIPNGKVYAKTKLEYKNKKGPLINLFINIVIRN